MGKWVTVAAWALAGCAAENGVEQNGAAPATSNRVETSGKSAVPLDEVPPEVLAAATAARPGFRPAEAERETREGRNYFDVGGTLPDGSEIEFDIMEESGRWRVVESQRDIAFAAAPESVRTGAVAHDRTLVPTRVIESTQGDGVVIFELYAAAGQDPQGRKLEVKLQNGRAEVLAQEWEH